MWRSNSIHPHIEQTGYRRTIPSVMLYLRTMETTHAAQSLVFHSA
jgi:hypothetical protein